MTNYNERLYKALERLAVAGRGWGVSESAQIESMRSELDVAKRAILAWHNKQVEEAMAKFHLKKGVKYDVKASDSVIVITHTNKLKESNIC